MMRRLHRMRVPSTPNLQHSAGSADICIQKNQFVRRSWRMPDKLVFACDSISDVLFQMFEFRFSVSSFGLQMFGFCVCSSFLLVIDCIFLQGKIWVLMMQASVRYILSSLFWCASKFHAVQISRGWSCQKILCVCLLCILCRIIACRRL